jgi:hypothetical protein
MPQTIRQGGTFLAKPIGTEGMTDDQLRFEINRGGKFVYYQYCISVIIITFRRNSPIYFIKEGESRTSKGVPWTLLTLLAGWWGIPFGPIFSIQSLITNFRGGKDVTNQLVINVQPAAAAKTAGGSQ